MKSRNPFRTGRPVRGGYFAGRRDETDRVEKALRTVGGRLLIYGEPLAGKSSLLSEAQGRLRSQGLPAVVVDLGTATNVADMATRVLRATSTQLKKTWKRVGPQLAERLGTRVTVEQDPVTGKRTPSVERAARAAPVEAQREMLGAVLDALEFLASERGQVLGVGLDGIHTVARLGGDNALWHLRGVIQRHRRLAYVLVGSDREATEAMTSRENAFHDFCDLLEVRPLPAKALANWIEGRLSAAGIKLKRGVGREMVRMAGPRTGDVVRLAARTFDMARDGQKVKTLDLVRVRDQLVADFDELLSEEWSHLTARQQNLMRALAAGELQPFAKRVRRLYDLRSSAAVARTLELLIQKGMVARSAAGYGVVSPFRARWIELKALPDLAGTGG